VDGGPIAQGGGGVQQRRAEFGQGVLHAGRNGGIDGAGQQTVTFELPQGQCEHPLGDAGDGTVKLAEAQRAVAELSDDQDAPLVADHAKDLQHLRAHVLVGLAAFARVDDGCQWAVRDGGQRLSPCT
jgi:hypothetical protein